MGGSVSPARACSDGGCLLRRRHQRRREVHPSISAWALPTFHAMARHDHPASRLPVLSIPAVEAAPSFGDACGGAAVRGHGAVVRTVGLLLIMTDGSGSDGPRYLGWTVNEIPSTPDGKPNRVHPLPQYPAFIATSHGAAEPGDGGGSAPVAQQPRLTLAQPRHLQTTPRPLAGDRP